MVGNLILSVGSDFTYKHSEHVGGINIKYEDVLCVVYYIQSHGGVSSPAKC